LGGFERGFGIFISKVDKRSKAEDVGLKRGDQILEVNGQSFEHVNHAKALDILRASTHLSITVKSNLLGECKSSIYFFNLIFTVYYLRHGQTEDRALSQSTFRLQTLGEMILLKLFLMKIYFSNAAKATIVAFCL